MFQTLLQITNSKSAAVITKLHVCRGRIESLPSVATVAKARHCPLAVLTRFQAIGLLVSLPEWVLKCISRLDFPLNSFLQTSH